MSVEAERRALELFAESLDVPADEREAWLRARAGDEEVLAILRRMLAVSSPTRTLEQKSGSESLLAALRLEGRVFGDFRLVRELGRGAVGRVFEAEQLSLHRTVAVKVLSLEHCQNAEMLRRFHQEPEFQAKLQHPHIVRVLATGRCDGWSYFAMEFVRGQSLAARLDAHAGDREAARPRDGASVRACVALVEKVARALHHAHLAGVVHRDIKPHNILVDEAGEPYLSDFGLARVIDNATLTGSLENGLRGTLPYMSPEQAHDFHSANPRADVYSLGAVLYQLLTRSLPFDADTSHELLTKILSPEAHVRPPHHFLRDFDAALSSICTKALEKDPKDRFATAEEFADCLRAFLDGRKVACRPISRLRQSGERRRSLSRLAGNTTLAAGILAAGLLSGRRVFGREPAAAPLRFSLSLSEASKARASDTAGDFALDLELQRLDASGAIVERFALGRQRGDCEVFLPSGPYRIRLTAADGAFAELTRELHAGDEVALELSPALARCEEVASGMLRVPAGSGRYFDGEHEIPFDCQAFWIDRAPVTNGEFRAFLQATGQWPSPEWSDAWTALWNGTGPILRPENWDKLPVVKVSWAMARAYAEWNGKRLPTAAEWTLVLGFGANPRVPEESWRQWQERFAFGRPPSLTSADGSPSSTLAYLSFVPAVPADGRDGFGPYGLQHAFGSVGQWLETFDFRTDDAGRRVPSGLHFEAHAAWHFDPLAPEQYLSRRPADTASADLGFRCAKSADP
ncbi:MAG: bifunctional serine/threonine-protein kinase/formylglycine-generating enzyme family protein [Planctomycetota bacterium]